jgi:hypothetical protein
MIIEYKDESKQGLDGSIFTYDSENDILIMGNESEQLLLIEGTKYFELDKNNLIYLKSGIDDLLDDYQDFFMKCLEQRLLKFGITIEYKKISGLQRVPIFNIKSDEDYAYFLFLYHDYITKSIGFLIT